MKGKFIIDCYNNATDGWFHVLPIKDPDAKPLLEQYELAKKRHGSQYHNIFPYNNSWWSIVSAESVMEAIIIFFNIYKEEINARSKTI